MRAKAVWFRWPNTTGLWWYWLLGSGMIRTQMIHRNVGFFRPELKGRLEVVNNEQGPNGVKRMARLWCRSTARPGLPPKKMRNELEARFVGGRCGPGSRDH